MDCILEPQLIPETTDVGEIPPPQSQGHSPHLWRWCMGGMQPKKGTSKLQISESVDMDSLGDRGKLWEMGCVHTVMKPSPVHEPQDWHRKRRWNYCMVHTSADK